MALDNSVTMILVTKLFLAILAFCVGGFLVWAGINILKGENGKLGEAISKFKFWGIDMSSPSTGLTVVVVSVAWILVGVRVMPEVEVQNGPVRITFQDISKPVAGTVAALKAPQSGTSPTIEETISHFSELAEKKYGNARGATVETDFDLERGQPVLRLRAASNEKTIEETYVPSIEDGKIEFTPIGVAATDVHFPEVTMKFDCNSSIEAFMRKIRSEKPAPDMQTHRRALRNLCGKEIDALPPDQRAKIESKD